MAPNEDLFLQTPHALYHRRDSQTFYRKVRFRFITVFVSLVTTVVLTDVRYQFVLAYFVQNKMC